VSSAKSQDDRAATANISLFGDVLKLSFRDTGKYGGLVASEPLAKVMRDFSVLLTASVLPPKNPAGKKPKDDLQHPEANVLVRVLVYGLISEKDAVGCFLSDHDLFFQHPLPSELDNSVPYLNPHYLLPPGSQMPDLERLSLCDSKNSTPVEVLGDVAKARLMRVFDIAYDPELTIEAKPSQRLRSTLKRYSRHPICLLSGQALTWQQTPAIGVSDDDRNRMRNHQGRKVSHPLGVFHQAQWRPVVSNFSAQLPAASSPFSTVSSPLLAIGIA